MSRKIVNRILLTLALTLAFPTGLAAQRNYKFQSQSVLAKGKWVKVKTAKSGIHEISYATLREMGFSNPAQVSVYGEGGRFRPLHLMEADLKTQPDDPEQVAVLHKDDKLYFYAIGLNDPKLTDEGYVAGEMNIYNTRSHYYLTDYGTPLLMATSGDVADNPVDASVGYGYSFHEKDVLYGNHNSGQYFWEYSIIDEPLKSWTVRPALMADNCMGSLGADIMVWVTEKTLTPPGSFSVALNGKKESWVPGTENVSQLSTYRVDSVSLPLGNVDITISSNEPWVDDAWLDKWILTYDKDIRKATSTMRQERLGILGNKPGGFVAIPQGCMGFDVTDPVHPTVMAATDSRAWLQQDKDIQELVFINPEKTQYGVTNPQEIANQNIHALKYEPYEFIIYTTSEFRQQADKIAELHKKYDGTLTLVLDVNDVYNEFSSGNVDPMALRLCTKMFYENGDRVLKNVMLFGPIRSDVRDILRNGNPDNFIIGFQEGGTQAGRALAIALDFYGMTADNVAPSLYNSPMDVGVGTLPVNSAEEADLAVSKIGSYLAHLNSGDMANIVNETMAVSCTGDTHTHDHAAQSIDTTFHKYVRAAGIPKIPHSTVMYDYYVTPGATTAFCDKLNDGKLMSIYIGHSTQSGLGGFISTGDITSLNNTIPTFMFFAGCDIAYPDFGGGGIGIDAVLRAPRGLIGSVSSTRTAYSNANLTLCQIFIKNLYYSSGSAQKTRTRPATAGEIYGRAKSEMAQPNELPFIYIGDPALTIPVTLLEVRTDALAKSEYRGGDILEIKGTVRDTRGYLYTSYNGTIVVKVCAPSQQRRQLTDPSFINTFYDDKMTTVTANVRSGKFTVRIPLPKECDRFLSFTGENRNNLNVYLSSYNPFSHMAGGGYVEVPMAYENSQTAATPDTDAPSVSLSYNDDTRNLDIEIADNTAIMTGVGNGGGISVTIDGKPVTITSDKPGAVMLSYATSVPLDTYATGRHSAVVTAKDMAGNVSKGATLEFNISENGPAVNFRANSEYAVDHMTFTLASSLNTLEMVIYDPDGKQVYNSYVSPGNFSWECADAQRGTYRAAVRSSRAGRASSGWVSFTLID